MKRLVAESLNEDFYHKNADELFLVKDTTRKLIAAQIRSGQELEDIKQGLIDLIDDLIEEMEYR